MVSPNVKTDETSELLERVATLRCKKSYESLFKLIAPRLLGFGRKQLNDENLALELVQETMIKLWTKSHLFDVNKGAALTWIYTVARNVKFDILRRSQHQRDWIQGDDLWPFLSEENSDQHFTPELAPVLAQELGTLINQLPPPQAEVIRLVYLQGASQQEVAERLELPLGTVKSRLRLGLKKLKEELDV